MSDQLAISATLSVLLLSAFVLLSPATARVPLGPQAISAGAALPALPSASALLPTIR